MLIFRGVLVLFLYMYCTVAVAANNTYREIVKVETLTRPPTAPSYLPVVAINPLLCLLARRQTICGECSLLFSQAGTDMATPLTATRIVSRKGAVAVLFVVLLICSTAATFAAAAFSSSSSSSRDAALASWPRAVVVRRRSSSRRYRHSISDVERDNADSLLSVVAADRPDATASPASLLSRRNAFAALVVPSFLLLSMPASSNAEEQSPPADKRRGLVTVTLETPEQALGLEVYDVKIGTPPQKVVAIRQVVVRNERNRKLLPGMVCRDFGETGVAGLRERLQDPDAYPVILRFENLAARGDAISDLGTPMVTSEDALELAKKLSVPSSAPREGGGYSVAVVEKGGPSCSIQSRKLDLLEIRYDAHLNSPDGVVYDSSSSRGTGQPYQMVLGSYDMLPGVDQGLYEMCPGDVRVLTIPPQLAYGSRGSKLYRIPPDTTLVWKVELISINGVRQGDTRARDDMEGRYEY